MLNIPKEVKELFEKDSVRKNLRIHFPNGEREDITNSNLIAESFSFTESVMSQSEFRFGLCEASMVEFECFGVENIKGYEIKAYHEIDISSLGEEFIAEYGMTSEDVAFPFYRVPYGKFKVKEALRQSDMVRRKVTAYGVFIENTELNEVEVVKRKVGLSKSHKYEFDLYKFMYSNLPGDFNISNATYENVGRKFNRIELPLDQFGFEIEEINFYEHSVSASNNLYYLQYGEMLKTREELKNELILLIKEEYGEGSSVLDDVLSFYEIIEKYITQPRVYFVGDDTRGYDAYPQNNYYVYPYMPNGEFEFIIPIGFKLLLFNRSDLSQYRVIGEFSFKNEEDVSIQRVTTNFPEYTFSLPQIKNSEGYYIVVDFAESNPYNIIQSSLEFMGLFGRYDRYGNFKTISLSNNFGLYPSEDLYPSETLYPREASGGTLTKGNYLSAWYDDEYTKPYDRVSVSYKNADEEEIYAEHLLVDIESDTYNASDYQSYSLSENYLIQNGTFTEAQITEILQTVGEALQNIRYMPCEIDAVGMPWVEAGDGLEIVTNNGSFDTLVLNRRINGIQRLIDNIEAD